MATISARKISDALQKAKGVGLVEERFVVGDCEVTVRNLRPDEYEAIIKECSSFEDIAYLNVFQKGHICRAIVEVNGVSFRDVDFVEVEEDDPKKPGSVKVVKLELHAYLNRYVVSTWSREVVFTAYRKVGDAVSQAERRSKDGITFIIPDETAEDKYRRLMGDLKEVEDELPYELISKILEDNGLVRKMALEEAKKALEKADELARQAKTTEEAKSIQEASDVPQATTQSQDPLVSTLQESSPTPQSISTPIPAQPESPPDLVSAKSNVLRVSNAEAAKARAEEVMRSRQPMNQVSVEVPLPGASETQQSLVPNSSFTGNISSRVREAAALEGGIALPEGPLPATVRPVGTGIGEIVKQAPVDPSKAQQILEQPPIAGINPRWRPPHRG